MIARIPAALPSAIALSEVERLRRIGAWVCRVALTVPAESPATPLNRALGNAEVANSHNRPLHSATLFADEPPPVRVLRYLRTVGAAGPQEIRVRLGLSRTTVYRALQVLIHDKTVHQRGQTKALEYYPSSFDLGRN